MNKEELEKVEQLIEQKDSATEGLACRTASCRHSRAVQ